LNFGVIHLHLIAVGYGDPPTPQVVLITTINCFVLLL